MRYITASVPAGLVFIFTPSDDTGEWQPVLTAVYGCVITPICEELIFRGPVRIKLKKLKSEWTVFAVDTALFGLWRLGYADSVAFRVREGYANVMFRKGMTGLCFGVVIASSVKMKKPEKRYAGWFSPRKIQSMMKAPY